MNEDNRHIRQIAGEVVILAPTKGKARSYHQSLSSREVFLKAREAFKTAGGRRRGKEVLYAR